jgi:hypothetical protein
MNRAPDSVQICLFFWNRAIFCTGMYSCMGGAHGEINPAPVDTAFPLAGRKS